MSVAGGAASVAPAERVDGVGTAPSRRAMGCDRCLAVRRWIGRSLGRRFAFMSLALLLVIQLTSFIAIDASLHRHAHAALPQQLDMGKRTLESLIGWRAEKFAEGAKLLAADYGFRAAVLSNDRETIASALTNHGARIGATEVAVLDVRLGTVALAEGEAPDQKSVSAAALRLAPVAMRKGSASEIALIGGVPRQVVLVPMKAPMLVGWVLISFEMPESLAESVHALSGADLTVLSRQHPDAPWTIALSRLREPEATALARHVWDGEHGAFGNAGMLDLALDGKGFGVHPAWLTAESSAAGASAGVGPGSAAGTRGYVRVDAAAPLGAGGGAEASNASPDVLALLTVSVDEAVRPPRDLQIALLVTTLLGVVGFGVATAYAARRITTPLQSLARAAERLGNGDLLTPIRGIVVEGEGIRDEVDELAQAFEQMRVSVATKQEQILQSEKLASIGQLAAGVAHEINNPIGFVFSNFGSLETYLARLFRMLDAYREEERQLAGTPAAARLARMRDEIELEYLQEDIPALMSESKDGIRRVRKIVQDLKDFSHVDARQEWERADLHAGLESTLNIVGNEVKYRAEVVKEYGTLPAVECLPGELNQVFMNLLVNAAHALGDRRGTITLRTGLQADMVWVEVADTGCGIAPADMKRIFDPFFTTKPVGKGTGLGLSLSYGIVKKHGGRIEVESEPGRGTTFRVWVPVSRPEAKLG